MELKIVLSNALDTLLKNYLKTIGIFVWYALSILLINFIFKGFGIALTIFFLMPLMNYIIVGFYEEARVSYNVMQKMAHTKIVDY